MQVVRGPVVALSFSVLLLEVAFCNSLNVMALPSATMVLMKEIVKEVWDILSNDIINNLAAGCFL